MRQPLLILCTVFVLVSVTHGFEVKDQAALHELACNNPKKGDSPWNVANLYDCKKKRLFIPYQLWTGAKWDGNKDAPCMHGAYTVFMVNGSSTTYIVGPKEWKGNQVWVREKASGSKTQYFTCHAKGIGRLWEVRNGRERVLKPGRCKFPAGYGWEVGKQRYCVKTALTIYQVEFDHDHNLSALEFEYWIKRRSRYVLDHKYRYAPEQGNLNAWRQR